ncbi:hypothetical protein ILUMI_12271 [Ignelater luminosus]|uniref:Uncharacterized protein n=1 Tax=Ignelater luminosus TaxID=2038154 RepID=A0A8K0D381_IGNLU|nr:hypothetical protein ILUMI_12271 [Ignelater luminosus]
MTDVRNSWYGPLAPIRTQCFCQSHLHPQLSVDFYQYGTFSDDPCWKCLLKCYGLTLNIMSSAGQVDTQAWANQFPYVTPQIAQKCSNSIVSEPDLCEKAYLLVKCSYDTLAKQYPAKNFECSVVKGTVLMCFLFGANVHKLIVNDVVFLCKL